MPSAAEIAVILLGLLLLQGARAAESAAVEFELQIENSQLVQAAKVIRVYQGDRVLLGLRSDQAVALHLHGYDLEQQLLAGVVATLAFEAYASGRFPLTLHSETPRKKHGAALLYLEVLPR